MATPTSFSKKPAPSVYAKQKAPATPKAPRKPGPTRPMPGETPGAGFKTKTMTPGPLYAKDFPAKSAGKPAMFNKLPIPAGLKVPTRGSGVGAGQKRGIGKPLVK